MSASKTLLISLGIFILISIGAIFLSTSPTGKITFELKSVYSEGDPLDGTLKLVLKEGELVPTSSMIVFRNNGAANEYLLSDYVTDRAIEGDFYVEGESLSGSGEGYGLIGRSAEFPVVEFKLAIGSGPSNQGQEDAEENTPPESPQEEPSGQGNANANSGQGNNPITGEVILEIEEEIDGEVSFGEKFEYKLGDGQNAEIVKGSVTSSSENLRDNLVSLEIENGVAIVTTSYQIETGDGFGEEFLGEKTKDISIDLSRFNLVTTEGDLEIGLVYNGDEFVSLSTTLSEGQETRASGRTKNVAERAIGVLSPLNPALNRTMIVEEPLMLTDLEREVLLGMFGNESVKITKAERTNEAVIIRHEIGDFWVEHYHNPEISIEELGAQVEEDRIRFLKDLANKFSSFGSSREELSELIGEYEI